MYTILIVIGCKAQDTMRHLSIREESWLVVIIKKEKERDMILHKEKKRSDLEDYPAHQII